ncbi:VanZ family protein [Paenibacillus sp. FSL L8-0470]|uniref:VanZ family protein n=1 Tax=unclassified Paenibacillus TaxID=185978 RepID=UPI0030F8E821
MKRTQATREIAVQILFALYVYALFKIILFKFSSINFIFLWDQLQRSPQNLDRAMQWGNFIPLATISNTFDNLTSHTLLNVGGNIALFLPYGMFLMLQSGGQRISLLYVLIRSLGLSLLLECAQAILSIGTFDVDDLILNTLGGVIGYSMLLLFAHKKKVQPAKES